jgi:hypothetical protein
MLHTRLLQMLITVAYAQYRLHSYLSPLLLRSGITHETTLLLWNAIGALPFDPCYNLYANDFGKPCLLSLTHKQGAFNLTRY